MKPTIRKLVSGVSMQLGHDGLRNLLKKEGIDVDTLAGSDLVMCINTLGDKLKVIGARGLVLGYLKLPGGRKIDKTALQYIPQTFGASGFSYDDAVRTRILRDRPELERVNSPLTRAQKIKEAGVSSK